MDKLLILYPDLFQCRSKFERKVGNIVSRIDNLDVIFSADSHGFIAQFFEENTINADLHQIDNWREEGKISFAIVFDDGEEFREDIKWLEKNCTHLRWIKTPLTRVVNIRSEVKYQKQKSSRAYEYIGRGSYWGNPYSMYEGGESRDEVIRKYQYDFERDIFPNKKKAEVYELMGKRLGCFCKPAACHGDILTDYLNGFDDGK